MDRQVGTTSQIIQVSIANSSTGAGLTGLAYNTSGLIAYYKRNSATASVAISLATMTLGTWATGGFKEVDATHMPGLYEIGIPNAALVSGADLLAITLQGAASMASRGGMTALPNAAAAAAGGLTTSATGYIVLKKDTALNNFLVYMVSSVDNVTPVTGATVSGQRSIDGGAFGACANSVTEVGLGLYVINLATTDTNGNCIMFQFTATGCAINPIPVYTQP
jgi:hypothetical protein